MNFNEKKYRKCIDHLINLKTFIVLSYLFIFAVIGGCASYPIMDYLYKNWYILAIGVCFGAFIGLVLGLYSTWKVEMKIQEAYWKIDVINELKKQTTLATKNAPIAKTVVAIENRQTPQEKITKK